MMEKTKLVAQATGFCSYGKINEKFLTKQQESVAQTTLTTFLYNSKIKTT